VRLSGTAPLGGGFDPLIHVTVGTLAGLHLLKQRLAHRGIVLRDCIRKADGA
jgi:hypothetical protein